MKLASIRRPQVRLVHLVSMASLLGVWAGGPLAGIAQERPDVGEEVGVEAPAAGGGDSAPGVAAGTRTEIDSDTDLAVQLDRVYDRVPEFHEVEATVVDRVVRLEGSVPTAGAREAAGSIAASFAHTLYVDNRIQVVDAPADERKSPTERSVEDEVVRNRLATIFARVEELQQVSVEVEAGVVQLTGETASPEAVDRAERLARGLEGVYYVDNDIEVLHEVGERLSPALQTAGERLVEFVRALPLVAVALVILGIFWGLARLARRIPLPGDRFEEQPFLEELARQAIVVVVFLIGVLFVLELFEVTTLVGAVLGTAGVAGLALGLAFRDIAENYLASILLGVQQPFRKNDLVAIDQFEGKVVRLTRRATVLMTVDGNHVRIPNATVFKESISNYTENPRRRFKVRVAVGGDQDLVAAQRVGAQMLLEANSVLDDPEPFATIDELGESTVTIAYYGWMDQRAYDFEKVRGEVFRHLKGVLESEGIEMPEPTYRVLTAELESAREEESERRERASRDLDRPVQDLEPKPDLDEQIEQDREHSEEADLLSS